MTGSESGEGTWVGRCDRDGPREGDMDLGGWGEDGEVWPFPCEGELPRSEARYSGG